MIPTRSVAWTRLGLERLNSETPPEVDWLEPAPGSKKGFSVVITSVDFTTGSTGTEKDFATIIASSLGNRSAHLSSKLFRSSVEGLLLDLFLLGLGVIRTLLPSRGGFRLLNSLLSVYLSQHTDFWKVHESGGRGGRNWLFITILPISVGGVASCSNCSGVNVLQMEQSFFRTHRLSPTPLSLHLVHLRRPSNTAITWPQVPLFCPGNNMIISNIAELCGNS